MDKKIMKALKKIVKVIKYFEEDVKLILGGSELKVDSKGRLIDKKDEIDVKMAFMTLKNRYNVTETINNQSSILMNKKECYYILKETDTFKITENMKVKYKSQVYRINAIEENYGIFLRMELDITDERDN